ncbi:hypothetical protein T8K17_22355 [Thalassobaculum sp. OXR-137]|uniref:hypothetical protein n=1 Tax=Thalassobaculum sp. OXR-137 TaxID=3100173 RepID=UPI002AC8E526|nr:hypothetical protein [Thalassobaculum sp. OXR-137]WPZ33969.1 hypothetical protein T8K17_22355 [Thalassobaculum sp. OXR-137]
MRIRSIAIVTGIALVALIAMPATLLGGAILAQSYAPESLRFAVHTATVVTEDGLDAAEIETAWASVRNTMDLNPVNVAVAEELGFESAEIQAPR